MNPALSGMVALTGALLMFYGCARTEAPTTGGPGTATAKLEAEVSGARERIAQQAAENTQLSRENLLLRKKISALEAAVTEKAGKEADSGRGAKPAGSDDDASEQARVALMGAKALAEYKAAKLTERLNVLSSDLDRKQKELEAIRQDARTKDAEVTTLQKRIDELQNQETKRAAELNARLDKIRSELEKRTLEGQTFKKELDEKVGLLEALKNAVGDASKLKSAAEGEVARLQAALQQTTVRLNEVSGQAEQFQKHIQELRAHVEQSSQEKDRCRQEAETYRQELERQQKVAQELSAEVTELTSRLDALAPVAEDSEEDRPSAVDLLLRVPFAKEKS